MLHVFLSNSTQGCSHQGPGFSATPSMQTSSFDCEHIVGVTRCSGCCWPARCQSPLAVDQEFDVIGALQQQVKAPMSALAASMLLLMQNARRGMRQLTSEQHHAERAVSRMSIISLVSSEGCPCSS